MVKREQQCVRMNPVNCVNNVWGIAYGLYRQVESLQLSYDADMTSEDHLMVLPVNMTMLVAISRR